MTHQEVAREIAMHFEGCHLISYVLKGETWATVGWGRAIAMSMHPMHITQAQADAFLLEDIARKDKDLDREIMPNVLKKLTPLQRGAILSFRYNVKPSAWLPSTSRKLLNAGDIKGFTKRLKLWNQGEAGPLPGLMRRRKCERFLLLGGSLEDLKKKNWFMNDYKTDTLGE